MTGGSLGLRSGSYGSLQQHIYNTSLLSAALPISSPPPTSRKNSKMVLPGFREKERRLPWICKLASRRKVGMLLLLIASVAVILSYFFFALTKDEDPPTGLETVIDNSVNTWTSLGHDVSSNSLNLPPIPVIEVQENKTSMSDTQLVGVNNEVQENTTLMSDTQLAGVNNEVQENTISVPDTQLAGVNNEVQENTTSMSDTQLAGVTNETQLLPTVNLTSIPSQHPCENFSLPPPPADPKRTGPRPCDVCYVPVELAMAYMPALPSASPIVKDLNYVSEEKLMSKESNGASIFGGHPSLQQRDASFDIKESMTVHCGFAKGKKPGLGTGFDIDEVDLLEMEQCHGVVIASAIFGNYDVMQQPRNISEDSKRTACFYMFLDEETEASIKNTTTVDSTKRIGLWRVVVVRNLPYSDARRNGKVPKLLLHRIFPNARFSLWIDGKLELVVDPYQILERFLWRNNASFAISRHYRRFDVFEEAEANKAGGKYDNASIDYQIEFYKKEGLTHFSPAKYPITSDVPEGCVIIREHIPITNLFTCLWFNEVDRFTSRDQLSFSTVRDKIMSKVNWSVNMFKDCERRNFVVQAYHRDVLEQKLASQRRQPQQVSTRNLPRKLIPDVVPDVATTKSTPKKTQIKRGKDRKSSSRKHRLKGAATVAKDLSVP